jgi:hypothetical protein
VNANGTTPSPAIPEALIARLDGHRDEIPHAIAGMAPALAAPRCRQGPSPGWPWNTPGYRDHFPAPQH